MKFLLIFFVAIIGLIAAETNQIIKPQNKAFLPMSERYPFPTSSPICKEHGSTIKADVALVYYPNDPSQTCSASGGQLKPYSAWLGYQYGVCTPNDLCGFNCDGVAACASKGYTVDEYNKCYNGTYGTCGSPTSYVKVTPFDSTQVIANIFSDAACTVSLAINNSTLAYYKYGKCDGIWIGCDYTTTTWQRVQGCVVASAANQAEWFLSI